MIIQSENNIKIAPLIATKSLEKLIRNGIKNPNEAMEKTMSIDTHKTLLLINLFIIFILNNY